MAVKLGMAGGFVLLVALAAGGVYLVLKAGEQPQTTPQDGTPQPANPQPTPQPTPQPAPTPSVTAPPSMRNLEGDGAIRGRVVDETDAPLEGAVVTLSAPTAPSLGDYRILADESDRAGEFAFEGLPTHRDDFLYHLQCDVRAGDRVARAQAVVSLGPAEEKRVRIVVTMRGAGRVEGTVTSGMGPAADVTVSLHAAQFDARARTDRDGRFRLDGLPEGRYTLRAYDGEPASGLFAELHRADLAVSGYTPANIFTQMGSLDLTLRESANGPPLSDAGVELLQPEQETGGVIVMRVVARGRTDSAGLVRFRLVPAGTFVVQTDRGPVTPPALSISGGANTISATLSTR